MPPWSDYKAHARERGSLAFEVYVAISTPVAGPEKLREVLPDHLAYQQSLERAGTLMFAGPMSDETGEEMQGVGMMVYRTASLEDARELAEADPMHSTGTRSFVLRRWMINEGSLNVSVGLSSRDLAL